MPTALPPQYEKREEVFYVPPLGQHYSHRWAAEDLQEEQSESLQLGQMADPLAHWDKEGQEKNGFGMCVVSVLSLISRDLRLLQIAAQIDNSGN